MKLMIDFAFVEIFLDEREDLIQIDSFFKKRIIIFDLKLLTSPDVASTIADLSVGPGMARDRRHRQGPLEERRHG